MGMFAWRAVAADGKVTKGRLPAVNGRELENRLQAAGLELLEARPIRTPLLFRARIPRRELIGFCLHMETTLRAGLMVTEALADQLDEGGHRGFRDTLTVVMQSVSEGTSFSDALAAFPETFDEVFVGMVRSGEASGNLGDAFERLAAGLRWQDELAAQLKKMILYPSFTIAILGAVTAFVLVYLVPELASFIASMGDGSLPWETRVLLAASDLLRSYWPHLLAAPFVCGAAIAVSLRIGGVVARQRLDAMRLRIPIFGAVLRKLLLARFCSLLGMLYAAGLPVIAALVTARDATGNREIAAAVDRVIQGIEQGRGVTDAFAAAGLFPNLVLRMIRIGETTGEIDKGLRNVAYFYDRDVQTRIAQIHAMTEPVLTLALGVLLAWLMMSVLGPIYDLLGRVGT